MLAPRSGKAKLDDVTRILTALEADLDSPSLSPTDQRKLLEQLKVHGRDPTNADPIFTRNGLRTLGRYAFGDKSEKAVSQEALRCLANALLLKSDARQTLVDLGHGPHAAQKLSSDSVDDEFLLSRILFLTTYGTTLDYAVLVKDYALATHINASMARHAARYEPRAPTSKQHTQPMELMALIETLKLIFNITHFNASLAAPLSPSTPHVLTILTQRTLPSKPLDPPTAQLINALLNLVSDGDTAPFPDSAPSVHVVYLTTLLDTTLQSPPPDADTALSPLITLLRRLYSIAPAPVQEEMRTRLLPSDSDRALPLGKSSSLASRLLNQSTSPTTPGLRESIAAFLYELSGSDAGTFVNNVGYGYASGFLVSKGIAVPEEAMARAQSGDADTAPVNPVTGQRLDAEEPVQVEDMTDEEKEREAERLFVLFERLRATGVVDVENPVTRAYREGRMEQGRVEEVGSDDE